MSKYTTEIRWIVEQATADSPKPIPRGASYPASVYGKLGLDAFEIYDEAHRYVLADKIINHYYVREIGFETVALFAWYMKQKMREIMPYYNLMYEALEKVTDPLLDFKRDRDESWQDTLGDSVSKTSRFDEATKTDVETSTKDRNVFQDTPMSMLEDDPSAIEGLKYATNVTYDDGEGSSSTSGTRGNERADSETRSKSESGSRQIRDSGFNTSQARLLKEYHDNMLNVDMEIIEELAELFMPLW